MCDWEPLATSPSNYPQSRRPYRELWAQGRRTAKTHCGHSTEGRRGRLRANENMPTPRRTSATGPRSARVAAAEAGTGASRWRAAGGPTQSHSCAKLRVAALRRSSSPTHVRRPSPHRAVRDGERPERPSVPGSSRLPLGFKLVYF